MDSFQFKPFEKDTPKACPFQLLAGVYWEYENP